MVSGFLGAGKTTFIKPYVAWLKACGKRPVVVENEFGFLNIDSAVLRSVGVDVAELSGGCLCCGLKAAFRDLLLQLARSDAHIVVEPSGIFNPRDFFAVMAEPEVAARCHIGTVITVVDPYAMDRLDPQSAVLFRDQVRAAGAVLLSRTGEMPDEDCVAAAMRVEALLNRPGETLIETTPWDLLTEADFARLSRSGSYQAEEEGGFIDHAALYQSLVIRSDKPLDKVEVCEAMDAARRTAGEVIRLKGYIPRRDGGFWEVNGTPDRSEAREVDGNARAFLVAIGRHLHRETLESFFMKELIKRSN